MEFGDFLCMEDILGVNHRHTIYTASRYSDIATLPTPHLVAHPGVLSPQVKLAPKISEWHRVNISIYMKWDDEVQSLPPSLFIIKLNLDTKSS